ncbi:hypothetical protein MJO28_013397 [Puccinia striiformis f. sp. tritici]|uniref:Uncharacterized protein n=1 Tax=Puccinia striiformis f. sp. tritici TaxID=168172 RepID=A0ACC0E144_9BASI|nr:hypothetical protein MJO28_013397 [Puccinia striiformis f. sp. tritici]KAI7942853.1 hypothetical protein MJO29_012697 [Puccinia striiformis f. sp. tritici]
MPPMRNKPTKKERDIPVEKHMRGGEGFLCLIYEKEKQSSYLHGAGDLIPLPSDDDHDDD